MHMVQNRIWYCLYLRDKQYSPLEQMFGGWFAYEDEYLQFAIHLYSNDEVKARSVGCNNNIDTCIRCTVITVVKKMYVHIRTNSFAMREALSKQNFFPSSTCKFRFIPRQSEIWQHISIFCAEHKKILCQILIFAIAE